jgi:hypothetical protein
MKREVLGYYYLSIAERDEILGVNGSPEEGTENYIKGYNSYKGTKRYSKSYVHPNSSCTCNEDGIPQAPIIGEETNVVGIVKSDCSESTLAAIKEKHLEKRGTEDLLTLEEVEALGWVMSEDE